MSLFITLHSFLLPVQNPICPAESLRFLFRISLIPVRGGFGHTIVDSGTRHGNVLETS